MSASRERANVAIYMLVTALLNLLTLVLSVLKLTDVIDWPWSWVLAPALISLASMAAILVVVIALLLWLKWKER